MGKCINHPDRETSYLCEECLKCRDPELYCKFRPSCTIWFLSKQKQKTEAEDKVAAM